MIPGKLRVLPLGSVLFVAVLLGISWPVVQWYISRMGDGSDEPFGILALIVWVGFIPWSRIWTAYARENGPRGAEGLMWVVVVGLLLLAPTLPNLIRAGVFVGAVSISGWIRGMPRGAVVLGFLSLPILASLDFYLGFPLRWACGWVGTHVLQGVGIPVVQDGIRMLIGDQEIVIDRPCSGLKYLWFGWFFAGFLTSWFRFSSLRVVVSSILTGLILFLANALRVTVLFLLEWRGVGGVSSHEWAGLVIFAFALIAILLVIRRIAKGAPAERPREPREGRAPAGTIVPVWGWGILLVGLVLQGYWLQAPAESVKNRSLAGQQDRSELGGLTLERSFEEGGLAAKLYRGKDSLILVREILKPTRRLHSAEDCFRGDGWEIETAPLWKDHYERNWRRFYATRDDERLEVRQRIEGGDGWNGTDVSEWFWHAVTRKTTGPWLAWVVVLEVPDIDPLEPG